jgi:hypothetical protein
MASIKNLNFFMKNEFFLQFLIEVGSDNLIDINKILPLLTHLKASM